MKKVKLTGWYRGDQKPVRVGVYERESSLTGNIVSSLWNGEFWCRYILDKEMAAKEKLPSDFQTLPWRGVAK